MFKGQKGITLVALVITIIILLILAGVTISLTLGDKGIFTTAQTAAKNYTNAQDKEIHDINNFGNTLNKVIENTTSNNN